MNTNAANHTGQIGKPRGGDSGRGRRRAWTARHRSGSAPKHASAGHGSGLRSVLGGEHLGGRGEPRVCLPDDAWVDLEAAEQAIHC